MGKIETKYDLTKALTIIKAVGKMKADDFHEWTANYYTGTVGLCSVPRLQNDAKLLGSVQEGRRCLVL
jgi:hypothetical protein